MQLKNSSNNWHRQPSWCVSDRATQEGRRTAVAAPDRTGSVLTAKLLKTANRLFFDSSARFLNA
jgi:hypothetical protein